MRETAPPSWGRKTLTAIVAVVSAAALTLTAGVPAFADDVDSTLEMTGSINASNVLGALPQSSGTRVDPTQGYPAEIPATGYKAAQSHRTALITARGDVTDRALLYCIDINTGTGSGTGYELGTWDEANVPYSGYIARILQDYFPNTSAPSGDETAKVAAVQSAIWFFSDGLVLSQDASARALTEAIVADVLNRGPAPEPVAPTVAISAPASTTVLSDEAAGPYTIQSDGDVTVTATGGTMWRDAAGTDPIANGTLVASGTEIYLRSDGSATATILATRTSTVQGGTALLYDKKGDKPQAQKLILAKDAVLSARAQASAQFTAIGSLVIDKSIVGEGADIHEEITLHVSGTNGLEDDFVIPAGATGTVSKTYERIPLGTVVTITEPGDGTFPGLSVSVTGLGQTTVESTEESHYAITNDYSKHFGSVRIVKTIDGSGAGLQDDVVLHISGTNGLEDDFVIPAGSTGETAKVYEGLPEGTVVTVTETADGANGRATCTVTEGEPATIATDQMAGIEFVNTYEEVVGSVEITKTIAGKGAGLQGDVLLNVSGSNGLEREIRVPAGTTGETSVVIDGIPVGTEITVREVFDGANGRVTVTVSEWDTAIVAVDEIVSIDVVNTYAQREGILAWTGMAPTVVAGAMGLGALLLAGGGVAVAVGKHRRSR